MQKVYTITVLALALTCAFAGYTPSNFVNSPVQVVDDNETNFTSTQDVSLGSLTLGELYVISENFTKNPSNVSFSNWTTWTKKLDGKSLKVNVNNSYKLAGPEKINYFNNYAFGFATEKDDKNISQIKVYQQPLSGGAVLPALTLTKNTNASWIPQPLDALIIGKTYYYFYEAASKLVNVTSFEMGKTVNTLEFNLTSSYSNGLFVNWGEALGTDQIYAVWVEGSTLKESVIDASKGTVKPVTVDNFTSEMVCSAYCTDKKYYGALCTLKDTAAGNTAIYARINHANLTKLATYKTDTSTLHDFYSYGQYLALFFEDTVSSQSARTYTYEIWDLDTVKTFRNRTQYLQIDSNSTAENFKVISGGLYTLIYNQTTANGPMTGIAVGLLLGSSYLASVLGFVLTIIAGLLFF